MVNFLKFIIIYISRLWFIENNFIFYSNLLNYFFCILSSEFNLSSTFDINILEIVIITFYIT